MKLQLSLFATLAITAPRSALGQDYLAFDAYGTPVQIANSEVAYDQNQNHAGGVSPTVSADHLSLRSTGNRWSAYQLPSTLEIMEDSILQFTFTLTQETDKGFQAICLDADRELTGPNGQCFVLSTSQGWIDNMVNAAKMTQVGMTTHHSIPIGHFFTGPVNYLAFLQDSDGTDRSLGDSAIGNLALVQEARNKLDVEINGVMEELENHQLSYTSRGNLQDTDDWLMAVTEDGSGVQINGNQWKALPLNNAYNVTHFTILEFDVTISEKTDFHSICLDTDLDAQSGEDPCVTITAPRDEVFHILTTEVENDVSTRLALPFGQIIGLAHDEFKVANYLVFVQDNDVGDKRGGRSTFSNIRIYEEDRMELKIGVYGENVTVPNVQKPFRSNSEQDSIDHVLSVSSDGRAITANGNNWKRFKLDQPFDVTPSTMMRFTFDVPHEAEFHAVCLLTDDINMSGKGRCFATSGIDSNGGSSSSWKYFYPQTPEGGSHNYDVLLGSYFTGPVEYVGFILDNDKVYTPSRVEGESTWSNIDFYSLPSLNIGLDAEPQPRERMQISSTLVLENNQITYESTSQDSTPVRDNLLVVSDDNLSITAYGNKWRALPLTTPLTAADLGDFVVSFDYVLTEPGEFHLLCFEDNLKVGKRTDPQRNDYDPARCLMLNYYETPSLPFETLYMPEVGEPHHYVINLSKTFDRFYELKYLAIISDNDQGDKSGGIMTVSNIQITTTLTSCLKDVSYAFQLSDCTIDNFLDSIKARMDEVSCPGQRDPLLEMLAFWDVKTEMDVYKKIEHVCNSAYESSEYDFTKVISSETQIVKEFIDGGTLLNYEVDDASASLAKDGAGISSADSYTTSHLLTWPKHHALDHCDIGAAMCCWVDSRGSAPLVDNSDVCYVDMKASKYTAHVKDGYSIYGDSLEGNLNCQGFAWGTDEGSMASALKGNALFKVGFMNNLYAGLTGNVEQVPGAPMCGCIDRMPVVTSAGCTKVMDDTGVVDITYNAALAAFDARYTMGTIEYTDCGDLNSYYKTLVGVDTPSADYIDTRIVGDAGCPEAINGFLAGKGLVMNS